MAANLVIGITGLIISLLGLFQVIRNRILETASRRYLLCFFSILTAYTVSNLAYQVSDQVLNLGWQPVFRLSLFFESLFSAALVPLLTAFLLHSGGGKSPWKNPVFRASLCLFAFYVGLLLYTQFSETIYYFDEQNEYHRGPWYPALMIPPVFMMILNLGLLWFMRGQLSGRQQAAFAVYILFPGVAMILQMLFYGLYLIVFGSSIAAFFMLSYVLTDQTERYYRQEAEIARLKNDIMLSQIQPHFVMNTLGAIGHLCSNSPDAKNAIQTFSRYMRGNIDVLSGNPMIPFEQELEHTRLYLDLEKLRFGDSLQVAWHLAGTDFMIPTLTLQPLVENAVRHGVRGNPDGKGTVRISTAEAEDRYEIRIEDDGPGFNPDAPKQDGRIHVGIPNVRERLRAICGGELAIDSRPGEGTRVTILLPKRGGDAA